MINRLATYISQSRPETGPYVIGITGIDASGKSTLTTLLEQELVQMGGVVQVVRLDDFHRPRIDRYREGLDEPEKYYEQSFDFNRLIDEVLEPIRDEGVLDTSLVCLDVVADTWTNERHYSVTSDSIVLLEGVFLFRPEISHFLDLIVFLRVDEGVAIDRALTRDASVLGANILERYQSKYLPAQRKYLAEYPSERNADIILDNNDVNNPLIIKGPQ